ncbi:hypothetical protein WR25_10675 [Diploscapter pachys]|uniref:Transmembrane protein n=1 Tax=Diploscapter pachys TaxID=2018661 RepID=A0A2A2LJ87_9BILA|nr:hypothetical protein WR25_10675 [Diploscapter pachys]
MVWFGRGFGSEKLDPSATLDNIESHLSEALAFRFLSLSSDFEEDGPFRWQQVVLALKMSTTSSLNYYFEQLLQNHWVKKAMETYSSTKKWHPLVETMLETMEGWLQGLQGIGLLLDEKTAGMRQRGLTLAETAGKYIALPVVFFTNIVFSFANIALFVWMMIREAWQSVHDRVFYAVRICIGAVILFTQYVYSCGRYLLDLCEKTAQEKLSDSAQHGVISSMSKRVAKLKSDASLHASALRKRVNLTAVVSNGFSTSTPKANGSATSTSTPH